MINDIPKFNTLENIRRKMNFESKLNCKDFHKAKKLDNQKMRMQQRAF